MSVGKDFTRQVFRAILFGTDEILQYAGIPDRPYLENPLMLAQRRNRQRPRLIRHANLEPIRKWFDVPARRWRSNEV